jgi:type I restriction enzyme R subunit
MSLIAPNISENFTFLKARWPDLASLASYAELYAFDDPSSSMVKLRIFSEKLVEILYYELGLPKPEEAFNFRDLLQGTAFKKAIPPQIQNFLHYIRKEGNKGAHESTIVLKSDEVIRLLGNVHKVSQWFAATVTQEKLVLQEYVPPARPLSHQELLAQKEALEIRLKELEASEEKHRKEIPLAESSENDLATIHNHAVREAETLGLTETQTRQLIIDSMLGDAGWVLLNKTSEYNPNSDKPQAIREYPVDHQPTSSGKGFIDYVLMGRDGIPVAVIEAKKTSESAEKGKTQAELYANGLEKMTGRRPFIFYTNGHDIYFWDDTQYPPRRVWGYFDTDKLEYMLFQRIQKKPLSQIELNTNIAGREYQLECIRRVYEDFESSRRKALVVMATGTGKTRVATSLIDGIMRANWGKRVLFLVDRLELQRQAQDAFKDFLPNETTVVVSSATRNERDARIYLATYNAMMNAYGGFNVGFFDLIIADESHRSIYKFYREIFQYFDAFQVGLTATPVDFVSRNTYKFFERETQDPTFYFSLDEAISHQPPYLVNYQVNNDSTEFLIKGIKYDALSEEQRSQLEEQDEEPQSFNYEREQVDRQVMNRETNKKILQNLMNLGIRNADGTRPGKTIIFARNHTHALLLEELFNELYSQYRGKMAQVIDTYNPRSQELIDGFKGKKKEFAELDIAISVDMLDTGIDVPEVVNLVFAKPVYSKVKFWQMIGRGTRLCENLFGEGQDKTHFLIFDPWRNFEDFGENPDGFEPKESKSVPERLFSVRLSLLAQVTTLLDQPHRGQGDSLAFDPNFENSVRSLLREDIATLPDTSVTVREKCREVEKVRKDSFWENLNPEFYAFLDEHIQPLMRWRNIEDNAVALRFDIKVTRLQLALAQGNGDAFLKAQESVLEDVERLRTNLNQVKQELEFIQAVKKAAWWQDVTLEKLEELRLRLRDLMRFRSLEKASVKSIDIEDYSVAGTKTAPATPENMEVYRQRIQQVLLDLLNSNLTLQKIRRGLPVTESDIISLQSLILEQVPGLKPEDLDRIFPQHSQSLDKLIRSLVGMDELTVRLAFEDFRKQHTTLQANQLQFLSLVEQEIIKSGGLEIARLYQQPFTSIHTLGLDGIFKEEEANKVIALIQQIVG